ncbi:hypothetical protein HMPREF1548_06439 [Clostridium sp. KLE 1755]|nr:hypothetical protein HMPREF1548_06439 [Clostridium sp. KLE 1755]
MQGTVARTFLHCFPFRGQWAGRTCRLRRPLHHDPALGEGL